MRHRLFTILAALPLLASVAICMVWVRSFSEIDSLSKLTESFDGAVTRHDLIMLTLSRGYFHFSSAKVIMQGSFLEHRHGWRWKEEKWNIPDQRAWWQRGFALESWTHKNFGDIRVDSSGVAIGAPYWVILAMTLLMPIFWLRNWVRRQK